MSKFISPIKELFYTTVNFNEVYLQNIKRGGIIHKGIDLRTRTGTNTNGIGTHILAVFDGKYGKMGKDNLLGNYITLEHEIDNEKYMTIYGHLDKLNFKPGWVTTKQGNCIGYSGKSGLWCFGSHLHFELRKQVKGNWVKIDPMPFFINGLTE